MNLTRYENWVAAAELLLRLLHQIGNEDTTGRNLVVDATGIEVKTQVLHYQNFDMCPSWQIVQPVLSKKYVRHLKRQMNANRWGDAR